jgi:hypothetical protein
MSFALMTAVVVAGAMGLLILADPRTQGYWGDRLADLAAALRGLIVR